MSQQKLLARGLRRERGVFLGGGARHAALLWAVCLTDSRFSFPLRVRSLRKLVRCQTLVLLHRPPP